MHFTPPIPHQRKKKKEKIIHLNICNKKKRETMIHFMKGEIGFFFE